MGLFPHIYTHQLLKLPVVFPSFTHGTRNIFAMEYIQGIFLPWIIFRRGETGWVAMVKFSKSPKTSISSHTPMKGGEGRFGAQLWHAIL